MSLRKVIKIARNRVHGITEEWKIARGPPPDPYRHSHSGNDYPSPSDVGNDPDWKPSSASTRTGQPNPYSANFGSNQPSILVWPFCDLEDDPEDAILTDYQLEGVHGRGKEQLHETVFHQALRQEVRPIRIPTGKSWADVTSLDASGIVTQVTEAGTRFSVAAVQSILRDLRESETTRMVFPPTVVVFSAPLVSELDAYQVTQVKVRATLQELSDVNLALPEGFNASMVSMLQSSLRASFDRHEEERKVYTYAFPSRGMSSEAATGESAKTWAVDGLLQSCQVMSLMEASQL